MRESLGKYITTISKYINYYINKRAENLNLNIHQVHILRILYNNEGINQEELTDIYKSDKVTISKLLDGLVKEQYVEKKKNDKDKRVKNLYVTEKGKSIREKISNILKDITKILSSGFTGKENIVIRELLDKMLKNIYQEVNEK